MNPHVQFDQIDAHVLLCILSMKQINMSFNNSLQLSRLNQKTFGLINPLIAALPNLVKNVLGTIVDYVKDIFMTDLTSSLMKAIVEVDEQLLSNACNNEMWESILSTVLNLVQHPPREIEINGDIFYHPTPNVCQHHKINCNHIQLVTGNTCTCCHITVPLGD